jgi:thiopurine S-methyltransferase
MDHDFWHERWDLNQIGFHESEANALMVAHLDALDLAPGARVFLPLCGKTRDIAWLLDRGSRVVGAELSEKAVRALFAEMDFAPEVSEQGRLRRFSGPDIDILAGDVFDVTAEALGPVDAVYDRAALVALPSGTRPRYAAHVHDITGGARQLLICFEYDQNVMPGPPFSVDAAEVGRVHAPRYGLKRLATQPVDGGLKGKCPATETVWLLT